MGSDVNRQPFGTAQIDEIALFLDRGQKSGEERFYKKLVSSSTKCYIPC